MKNIERIRKDANDPSIEKAVSEDETISGLSGYLIKNYENISNITFIAFVLAHVFLWIIPIHYLFNLSYIFSLIASIVFFLIYLIIILKLMDYIGEFFTGFSIIFFPIISLGLTIHYFFDLSYLISYIISIISIVVIFVLYVLIDDWFDKKRLEFEFCKRTLEDLEKELLYKEIPHKSLDVKDALVGRAVLKSEEDSVKKKVLTLLKEFISLRSIEDITYAKPELTNLIDSSLKDKNIIIGFTQLGKISSIIEKSEESLSSTDKLANLSKTLPILDETLNFTEAHLDGLIKNSFICIIESWKKATYNAMENVQGRAIIKADLITKKVKHENTIASILEIKNLGDTVTENVKVKLLPSSDYSNVRPRTIVLKTIDSGEVSQVEFQIDPIKNEGCKLSFQIEYDDIQGKGKIYEFTEEIEFFGISKEFVKIFPIPYIVGGPLKTDEMFYGRKDVLSFIRENLIGKYQNNAIILHGQRRTGKTSILYRLQETLGYDYITVLLDMHDMQVNNLNGFLYWISDNIFDTLNKRSIKVKEPAEFEFKHNPTNQFKNYIKDVEENLHDKHLVLMFDEFEALEKLENSVRKETNSSVFEYLRHYMQHHEKLDFIFVGTHKLDELTSDYYSILFGAGKFRKITFLAQSDVEKLITEPVKEFNLEYDDASIQKIFEISAGHPFFTQLICHELVEYHNEKKLNYISINHVDDVLEKVIEGGEAHFKFIWDNLCESQREKLVLSSIAKIRESSQNVLLKDINELFRKYNLIAERNEIRKVLDKLVKKDILEKVEHERDRYFIKIDLMRLWVNKYRNFSDIIDRIEW